MMNYLAIDESHIQFAFGILGDVLSFSTYPSGELEGVKLGGENMVMTHIGQLTPAYSENERRKQKPSIEFYKSGAIKSVMLEKQCEIETPIGTLPAEFVTFYESGEIHRVFVVNGQISGFWSEEDEKEYNIPLCFDVDFSQFKAYTNGICFYKSGDIKSITLFPGESITIDTPVGAMDTAVGFSLYESGCLKSIEPKEPVYLNTPIGKLYAFDANANGINADSNSLVFDEKGRIISICTDQNRILVQTDTEEFYILSPLETQHPLYDDMTILVPLNLRIDYEQNMVTIISDKEQTFSLSNTKFSIQEVESFKMGCTPADCATCSLCNSKN